MFAGLKGPKGQGPKRDFWMDLVDPYLLWQKGDELVHLLYAFKETIGLPIKAASRELASLQKIFGGQGRAGRWTKYAGSSGVP